MAQFDIFDTIEDLRRQGDAFCIATVMRTADATSAKAGAKAAVTESGEIIGHLGGACVQRAVKNAASETLSQGTPRVIRVKPSDKVVATQDGDGVQVFKSGCPSGGTVDLLIEPYEPMPRLVIFGATPISRALAAHAALAGYNVLVPDGIEFPGDDVGYFDPQEFSEIGISPRDFVVVASQGNGDMDALHKAIDCPARRVSMVASGRKANVLCQKLVAAGVPQDRVSRLKSPAGLDIKGVDPHEIAVSVLAEIVLWHNSDTTATRERGLGEEKLA
jgi:xanthine/CO dehydrogenase XdhC/CoxF family maturation factor